MISKGDFTRQYRIIIFKRKSSISKRIFAIILENNLKNEYLGIRQNDF